MPHPNERKIVMQIQTIAGKCTPTEAFKKGLEDLQEMCNHIKETFKVILKRISILIKFFI